MQSNLEIQYTCTLVHIQDTNTLPICMAPRINGSPFVRLGTDQIDISGTWQFASCSYLRFEYLNFKGNSKNPGRLFSIDNGGSCLTQSKHIVVRHCIFSNVTDPNAIAAFKFGGVDSFEVSNNIFKDFPSNKRDGL
jgi:hypothetical protein